MLSTKDHFYSDFERLIGEVARRPLVLDLGTYHGFRKELAAHARSFGHYLTMDIGAGFDRASDERPNVQGDVHRLPFRTDSVSAMLSKEVLEHVKDPKLAVGEMHRALEPGGLLFCSIPCLHPYHGDDELPDYWRFTKDGVSELFSAFSSIEIRRTGGLLFVVRAFSPSFVRRWLFSAPLMPLVNFLDRRTLGWQATNLWLVLARK